MLGIFSLIVMLSCRRGCTNPDSSNYDVKAKRDDGSCLMPCAGNESPYDTTYVGSQMIITVKDLSQAGTGTITWCNDAIYLLDGFVFVNSGQELSICPGTIIKGKQGNGENASALIVARGGKIYANGTATNPIVFTGEADPVDGTMALNATGLWGGLVILGNAQLNSSLNETAIEGLPTTEERGLYGGTNDADNSGLLTYVSIRHGGTDIGASNEINGLTLGGVGSGTTIENIEVIANADDGIECFGGKANIKYAVVSNCVDDAFDYDEGYRGNVQFLLAAQGAYTGNNLGEHDGGTTPETAPPYATPIFYNVTYIGRGLSADKRLITFRDNAGGEYHNSIFLNQAEGIDIENLASGEDSYSRYLAGDLKIKNNIFYDIAMLGSNATASDLITMSMGSGWLTDADSLNELNNSHSVLINDFASNGNSIADPGVIYFPLNPVPSNAANVGGATTPTDTWFTTTSFKGAFDPADSNWASGWTRLFE